jgi:hypothetical protein
MLDSLQRSASGRLEPRAHHEAVGTNQEMRAMSHNVVPFARLSKRRTYRGGCECGAVAYAIDLDLSQRDHRTHSVWEHSAPPTCFELLLGHDSLIGYQFSAEGAHHFFCLHCHARAFSLCAPEADPYYSVDLKALDGPLAKEHSELTDRPTGTLRRPPASHHRELAAQRGSSPR